MTPDETGPGRLQEAPEKAPDMEFSRFVELLKMSGSFEDLRRLLHEEVNKDAKQVKISTTC